MPVIVKNSMRERKQMSSQDQYDLYKYSKGKGCKKSGCENALATGIYQMLMSANSEIK